MLQTTYTFEELKMASQLVRDMIAEDAKVAPLLNRFYDPEKMLDQIKEKVVDSSKRLVMADALEKQHDSLSLSAKSIENLKALRQGTTFTITAGHQLNLLSGPLYAIYKVAQAVQLSQDLKAKYPSYDFVPVFWMATEDHDFEEINHLHLFGKKIQWDKTGQIDRITGRITTSEMSAFLDEVEGMFQDPTALEKIKVFTSAYRTSENLADATRKLMYGLFGEQGLLIIDGDDRVLKTLFSAAMIKEVKEEVGYQEVSKTNEQLASKGYHQQVFVRESNLFYIDDNGKRIRLVKEGDRFIIGDRSATAEELVAEIESFPERFSPNALYRPLYQEMILPNLVFIGGGGEMAYWLQLKSLFEAHGVTFPMLRTRDSFLIYNQQQFQLMQELRLDLNELKENLDGLIKQIVMNESETDLRLTEAIEELLKVKSMILEKSHQVNPGLDSMVEAEFAKMINSVEKLEAKLIKSEKGKHEQLQKKLEKLHASFFPGNGFQERYDNFLPYYLKDDSFLSKILTNLKPNKEPLIRTVEI